jgi:hypothetical protein
MAQHGAAPPGAVAPAAHVPPLLEFEQLDADEALAIEAAYAATELVLAQAGAGGAGAAWQPDAAQRWAHPAAAPPAGAARPEQRDEPPRPRPRVTCEALSWQEFAVVMPREEVDAAHAAVLSLRQSQLAQPTEGGGFELRLPFKHYERALTLLESATLLPKRSGVADGSDGRVPAFTLAALRHLADRKRPGSREFLKQARGGRACAARGTRGAPGSSAAHEREGLSGDARLTHAPLSRGSAQAAVEAAAEARFARIPAALRAALLPFQVEGVREGLRRDGRMLLADDMGVGKTMQALALGAAYAADGPLLVVVPSSLRLTWADQLERWLEGLRPHACSVILDSRDKPKLDNLPRTRDALEYARRARAEARTFAGAAAAADEPEAPPEPAWDRKPRVVVISYRMLDVLQLTIQDVAWGAVIADESHTLRTTNNACDSGQTEAAARVIKMAPRAFLLTGTPSLNRPFDLYRQVDALQPGLLGRSRFDFGAAYCEPRRTPQGLSFSGGVRLRELHALLRDTVMVRRMKAEVAAELPPKRRQVVRLDLQGVTPYAPPAATEGAAVLDPVHMSRERRTALHKLPVVCEWLRDTVLSPNSTGKVVIFAHHKDIMDGLHARVLERHLAAAVGGATAPYVRVDGSTDLRGRQDAVNRFRNDQHVRAALISVTAGGTGLDFSAADAVVFAELPLAAADLEQAEARVHRRGVNGNADGACSAATGCMRCACEPAC